MKDRSKKIIKKINENTIFFFFLVIFVAGISFWFYQSFLSPCRWVDLGNGNEKLLTVSKKCIPYGNDLLLDHPYNITAFGSPPSFHGDGDWEYLIKIPENEIGIVKNQIIKLGGKKITEKKFFSSRYYEYLIKEGCRRFSHYDEFSNIKECFNEYIYVYKKVIDVNEYKYIYMDTEKGIIFISHSRS